MTQPVIEPNFEGEEMKIPEGPGGMTEAEAPAMQTKSVLSTTMIVLLTVALIAIFAGLGYWYTLVMNDNADWIPEHGMLIPETNNNDMPNTDLSESDEIEAIEADIDNTEMEELDRELDQIDAELEAEMGA